LQNFTPGELKKTSLKPVATNTVRKNTILTPPAKKTKAVRGCGPSPGGKQGSGKKESCSTQNFSDQFPSPRRQAMSLEFA
jgi:hypothetical protein